MAASKCINLLARHLVHFSPQDLAAQAPAEQTSLINHAPQNFPLDDFDLVSLLKKGSLLLESSGQASLLQWLR